MHAKAWQTAKRLGGRRRPSPVTHHHGHRIVVASRHVPVSLTTARRRSLGVERIGSRASASIRLWNRRRLSLKVAIQSDGAAISPRWCDDALSAAGSPFREAVSGGVISACRSHNRSRKTVAFLSNSRLGTKPSNSITPACHRVLSDKESQHLSPHTVGPRLPCVSCHSPLDSYLGVSRGTGYQSEQHLTWTVGARRGQCPVVLRNACSFTRTHAPFAFPSRIAHGMFVHCTLPITWPRSDQLTTVAALGDGRSSSKPRAMIRMNCLRTQQLQTNRGPGRAMRPHGVSSPSVPLWSELQASKRQDAPPRLWESGSLGKPSDAAHSLHARQGLLPTPHPTREGRPPRLDNRKIGPAISLMLLCFVC